MPITKENRSRYPADWEEIRAEVLERADNRCEWEDCGVENGAEHPITGSTVVLTIMHLDHQPENNGTPGNRPNLKAACQRCHNRYDAPHRIANRAKTIAKKRQILQENAGIRRLEW